MAIRSHVQNSRFIIKRFRISNTNGCVKVLNLKDGTILEKGPMEIGTQNDYFDEETEQFLSNRYESPFAAVVNSIENDCKNGVYNTFSNEFIDAAKRFLIMLFIRKPEILDKSFDSTKIAKFLNYKPTPSEFVRLLEKTELVDQLLGDKKMVVVLNYNTNDKKFISSVKGFSVYGSKADTNECIWWLPFSPDIGIAFVGDFAFKEFFQGAYYPSLSEDASIEYFNDMIVDTTVNDGGEFVFTSNNVELDRTKQRLGL